MLFWIPKFTSSMQLKVWLSCHLPTRSERRYFKIEQPLQRGNRHRIYYATTLSFCRYIQNLGVFQSCSNEPAK